MQNSQNDMFDSMYSTSEQIVEIALQSIEKGLLDERFATMSLAHSIGKIAARDGMFFTKGTTINDWAQMLVALMLKSYKESKIN